MTLLHAFADNGEATILSTISSNTFETTVQNESTVSQQEDVTTSSQTPDTDLVTPLNGPAAKTEEIKDLPEDSTVPTEEEVVPE